MPRTDRCVRRRNRTRVIARSSASEVLVTVRVRCRMTVFFSIDHDDPDAREV